MSRIRTIKPDFFCSYSIANLSIEARLLFIGLLTEADDHGILIDSPKKLAGAVFPHDSKVTANKVDAWLTDIEKQGSIRRYEVLGCRYIEFTNWETHQRISHKARATLPRSSGALPGNPQPVPSDPPF